MNSAHRLVPRYLASAPLRTDRIDLLYQHRVDPAVLPVLEELNIGLMPFSPLGADTVLAYSGVEAPLQH
ncbi:hypothetical protein [Pseudomonas sp. ICMP 460]|uniref:hypothetical protein n=1 Tax=Pseudomonas sp. ICMP 460 TaxID=1718917 RepID=UPI000C08452A|nr:hypothetical protein [Pseudomonas sp. ICMP 460]PHN20244.1 hypothetical protein AO240_21970 [Pseudomonas sp. ICMP 460]